MQDSDQLKVENIDDKEFQDDIIVSNHIHKSEEDIGYISDQCIVPVAQVYGITRPDVSTNLTSSDLDYDLYKHAIDFDKKEPPFIDETLDVDHFDCGVINKLDEVKSFEDVINTEPGDLFLVDASNNYPTQKDTYYICSVEYKLVFNFNTDSNMYDKKLQYSKTKYLQSSIMSDLNDMHSVKYKFDNDFMKMREHKDGIFGIDPNVIEDYTSKIGFGIFCGMGIFSLLGTITHTTLFASLVGLLFVLIFILFGFLALHEEYGSFWMRASKTYDNEEKLQIPYSDMKRIDDINSDDTNNQNLNTVNVKVEDGKIVCEDENTTWDIYNDKYDIYEERATEFFVDMGFDSIQNEFSAYIVSSDADYDTNKTTLESDCGKYLLIPEENEVRASDNKV